MRSSVGRNSHLAVAAQQILVVVVFRRPGQVGDGRDRHVQVVFATGGGEHGLAELEVAVVRVEHHPARIAHAQRRGVQVAQRAQAALVALILDPREQRADQQIEYVQCVVLGCRLEHRGEGHQCGDAAVGRHARQHGRPGRGSVASQPLELADRKAG